MKKLLNRIYGTGCVNVKMDVSSMYPQFPYHFPNMDVASMYPATLLNVKVKYLRDVEKIKAISKGDWIDLRCAEDTTIKAGEYKLIPLGVAIELPKGYEALIVPRSSTFKNYGVFQTNHLGVIDETYCGDNDEWHMPVYATHNTLIEKGERICQFRIIKHQPQIRLVEVETLGNADRGGIGSTGTKEFVDTDSVKTPCGTQFINTRFMKVE